MVNQLAEEEVNFNNILGEIRSSFPDEDISVLYQRLNKDGYLCLRNLIPQNEVLRARKIFYEFLKNQIKFSNDSTIENPKSENGNFFSGGKKEITHHPDFINILEHPNIFNFFKQLFSEPCKTYDYKWVRTVGSNSYGTEAHMDIVYMGRGSKNLLTMWIPVGKITRENGPMVVLDKSHNHPKLKKIRDTYGRMDVDKDLIKGGWFTNNYSELSRLTKTKWLVGDYDPGDVLIVSIYTFHGSLRNNSDILRFTCDVRFQPESDSIDNRWIGENPIAHRDWWRGEKEGKTIEIDEARESWGV